MSDLLFICPSCLKSLAVVELGIGRYFPCPDCGTNVKAPEPAFYFACPSCNCNLCAPNALMGTNLNCPNCNVEITVQAEVI